MINVMHLQLYQWFKKCKGKERWTREILLLTEAHKAARLQHSEHMLTLLYQDAVICYLDEKWFYLNSRRKCAKHLPRAAYEAIGES
jgi:hypothetical protein